jgi:hypothetical protein
MISKNQIKGKKNIDFFILEILFYHLIELLSAEIVNKILLSLSKLTILLFC